MSIELAQVNRLMRQPAGTDWPKTYPPKALAYLQTWSEGIDAKAWNAKAAPWWDLLAVACGRGELPHTTTTERKMVSPARDVEPSRFDSWDHPAHATRDGVRYAYTVPAVYKVFTTHHIAAQDFAQWLAAQGEQPSRLLAAWFKSQGVVGVGVAQPAPAMEQVPPPAPATLMKRQALIDDLRPQWPTIENDLKESSRKGNEDLAAAKVQHGMWDRDKALAWAKSRGKVPTNNVHALPSVWPGGITRHQMKG